MLHLSISIIEEFVLDNLFTFFVKVLFNLAIKYKLEKFYLRLLIKVFIISTQLTTDNLNFLEFFWQFSLLWICNNFNLDSLLEAHIFIVKLVSYQ